MRIVIIVLLLAACGETRQVQRWPEHRRREDQRMTVLEDKVRELEQRLHALEQDAQRRRVAPAEAPAPAPPAALPSTGP